MQASGPCHTGIHAAVGDWPAKPAPPFTPPMKASAPSRRSAPAPACTRPATRSRSPGWARPAGTAPTASAAGETLCESQQNSGNSAYGRGQYALAGDRFGVTVPGGLPGLDVVPLTCAGVTTVKAVRALQDPAGQDRRSVRHRRARAPGPAVRAPVRRPGDRRQRAHHRPGHRDPKDLGSADVAISVATSPRARQGPHRTCSPLDAAGHTTVIAAPPVQLPIMR